MRNRTYGGVRGRKTKVGRKLLRFPPTRLCGLKEFYALLLMACIILASNSSHSSGLSFSKAFTASRP